MKKTLQVFMLYSKTQDAKLYCLHLTHRRKVGSEEYVVFFICNGRQHIVCKTYVAITFLQKVFGYHRCIGQDTTS